MERRARNFFQHPSSGSTLSGFARIAFRSSSPSIRNGSEMAISPGPGASPSWPQERLYPPHLPLNAELYRSGCVLRMFRSVEIAWNGADERHGTRVVDDALDVVEEELSAGIKVNATLEARPRPRGRHGQPYSFARVYLSPGLSFGSILDLIFTLTFFAGSIVTDVYLPTFFPKAHQG
jgi:hypothetical protein